MANQTITHSCGHTTTQQMYGPHRDRDAKAAALGEHPCPACRAGQAAVEAEKEGLPTLQGTDKQVAWASDIRARMLAQLDEMITKASGSESDKAKVLAAYAQVKSNTSARYWIDNRNAAPVQLIAAAAKAMPQ